MICDPSFFGLKKIPKIDLNKETLELLAEKSMSIGLTVPGVQKKLSLHLSDDDSGRLTLVGHPAGYILKPQTQEFEKLPEAEDLVMDIAEIMGAKVAPHGLIDLNGEKAYITKRVDRADGKIYAMEDFCQISGRQVADKYKGSYERCAAIIREHSVLPGFDISEFFLRLVICFATGNSDMHLKNFSLIEKEPGSREYVLSPAYDLLPVNLVMPEDEEETALTLNGKKSNIHRNDFLRFAETIGLNDRAAVKLIDSIVSKEKLANSLCDASFLRDEMKSSFKDLLRKRISILAGE